MIITQSFVQDPRESVMLRTGVISAVNAKSVCRFCYGNSGVRPPPEMRPVCENDVGHAGISAESTAGRQLRTYRKIVLKTAASSRGCRLPFQGVRNLIKLI